ncbi:MAG: helicase [Massilia sp.]|nr:helicase [Massilia sp.]
MQELDPAKVVVAWPEGESFRVGKQVGPKSMRLTIRRDKDWFAADGEVQVDENKVLDLRTLLDMLRSSQGRFVALGDNQFMALSSELHRRLMEFSSFGDSTADGVRVHPLASFALEELALDAGGVKADKTWKDHLKRMADNAAFTPQLPSTLQAELRDYQLEGYQWLARLAHWGVGACLADDMGLGKTVQALALMLARAPQGPALVVAPTSVCMNWIAEAEKFAPTLKVKLFGAGDRAAMLEGAEAFDLVIASYGLLQLEAAQFAKVKWHTIVLDEAQAIKNNATKRSHAVMALQGDFRMVATGTPLENHLGELWNLFRFINPGLLGTSDQFNLRFAGPIERAQDKRAEAGARTRLRRLIQPFILRRTKAQVLSELPPRTEIVLPVELSAEETALYESLRRDALEKLAALEAPESQKSIQILAEMMRLRRACCNPELVAPELGLASSKLAVFARLLDDLLENRHKVLVFSQFVDHLTLIRRHLDARGIGYQYLDGATPMAERKKRVDAFQGGKGDVFLISLKAGGVGINLTAADYVIHMDPWWNPAVEDQASDRAHRMGQQRPVTIYRLVAHHTIEEGIVELHKHKRDLADSLLEGSDLAARMSPGDMLKMLQEGLAK